MSIAMNTNDLYIEYARCIEMCKDTPLEDRPWDCIRRMGKHGHTYHFATHPDFIKLANLDGVQIAAAIIEDKALFVGDAIFRKEDGAHFSFIKSKHGSFLLRYMNKDKEILVSQPFLTENYTLQSPAPVTTPTPTPKRTFKLNGVELPCPIKTNNGVARSCYLSVEGVGFAGFKFDHQEDTEKVEQCLIDILSKAENQ